jgi:ketosteroid isomerase-like protein
VQEFSMKKYLSLVLVLCALAAGSPARSSSSGDDREADLRSIVEAERGFARMSEEKGMRAAFIENLADDGVLFRPGPVNGKKWWSERPVRPGVLSWRPVFADVARSGEMGYTTGPWEFREKSLEDKPVAFGQFVTVWKRQPDGAWKVAIDLGTGNPQPPLADAPAPEVKFPVSSKADKKLKLKMDAEAERSALFKVEDDYAKRVAAKKTAAAYLSFLAGDVRLFRTEAFPAVGREAARALLLKKPGVLSWQPTKVDVSRSGELGYTYGAYEFHADDVKASVESGNYLRIWKRQADGKWMVVLDILNPLPPKAAS